MHFGTTVVDFVYACHELVLIYLILMIYVFGGGLSEAPREGYLNPVVHHSLCLRVGFPAKASE